VLEWSGPAELYRHTENCARQSTPTDEYTIDLARETLLGWKNIHVLIPQFPRTAGIKDRNTSCCWYVREI